MRSWTTALTGSLFSERLYYQDAAASGSGAAPSYDGNIAAMSWTLAGDKPRMYAYAYDPLSRLTGARYFENGSYSGRYDTAYAYDRQCNVTSLTRYGRLGASTYGILDDLRLTYNGNRLSTIHDVALTPAALSRSIDFSVEQESDQTFRYDKNGNLTRDLSRGISNISYILLNLPSSLSISNSMGSATNTYRYSADGGSCRSASNRVGHYIVMITLSI